MLPDEITPFAQANIDAIDGVVSDISAILTSSVPVDIDPETLAKWQKALLPVPYALRRFEVCMHDEVNQKKRLRTKLYKHKLIP